jgi:transposase
MVAVFRATIFLEEASSMAQTLSGLGIDIAKLVLQVVGMDDTGAGGPSEAYRHAAPALIGMETCGNAHDWARCFREHGHRVKLMAPQFVKAEVKSPKHDARDADAIWAAVTRPPMRYVPIKQLEQHDLQALAQAHPVCQRVRAIPGSGPLTATAILREYTGRHRML